MVSHGTEILGIPIGCHQFVQTRCSKIANSGHALCSELVKLRCSQSATLLLRFCHVTWMNQIARCVSPYSFEYAAKLHDAMTRSTFVQILGLDSIDDFTWNQASLNIKLGGFGLSEVNKSKCSAYVSSWAQSVRDLPNRFSSLSQRIQDLVENDSTSSSLGFDIHSAVKSLPPVRLGDDETPGLNHCQPFQLQRVSFSTI